jgi:hypothetical protein
VNTTELGAHLRDVTDGLELPQDFTRQVLNGGRRRRRPRGIAVATSAAAVIALGAGSAVVVLHDAPSTNQVAEPTKGNLAGDHAFLDQARAAWRTGLSFAPDAASRFYDDRRGDPRVLWAGDTPAGRAAIVAQQVNVSEDIPADVPVGLQDVEGLFAIDPTDGKLKLVDVAGIGETQRGLADLYKFGPDDRTMLIVDRGKPLAYAYGYVQGEGKFKYEWHPVEPRDGVAIVRIPEGSDPRETVGFEGANPPAVLGDEYIQPFYRWTSSMYMGARLTDPTYRVPKLDLLPWKKIWELGTPLEENSPTQLDAIWGLYITGVEGGINDYHVSDWTITVGLPDKRIVILKEDKRGTETPRLTALVAKNVNLDTHDMIDGGAVDRDAVLPVRFRIPDGGGWIVAHRGTNLSYRTTPDGQWQDTGDDAALLPDNATQVKVGDQVVTLPH